MHSHTEYDVLLTYPAERLSLFDSMIPLGIASIAAVLEQNNYRVKIVDFNHYRGDFQRDLRRWNPRIIGIGGTTPTRSGSFLTARLSKKVLPQVPVVYGGVHATFTAADTLTHVPFIDYVIKGEGEFSFLKLCNHFIRKDACQDLCSIEGLCYMHNGEVIQNRHARIENLADLPIPARHLFDYSYAMTLDLFGCRADFLMTSRGCPAACTFCSASRMFPGGLRLRPMALVQYELESILAKKPIQAIKLFDSTFTASPEHVQAFCSMIRPYGLLWECEIRADTVDYGLLRIMKQAGCCCVNVGLETSNQEILDRIGKRITVGQVELVMAWCKMLDIKTKVFFTFGHIGQTYEQCKNDIFYIRQKKESIDFYATTIGMRVYPGTSLEKMMIRKKMLPEKFSWATFKAPFKNLLLLEPGDILILEQRRLSFFQLSRTIISLFFQRTVLSRSYIKKIVLNNLKAVIRQLCDQFRYTQHQVARMLITQQFNAHIHLLKERKVHQ